MAEAPSKAEAPRRTGGKKKRSSRKSAEPERPRVASPIYQPMQFVSDQIATLLSPAPEDAPKSADEPRPPHPLLSYVFSQNEPEPETAAPAAPATYEEALGLGTAARASSKDYKLHCAAAFKRERATRAGSSPIAARNLTSTGRSARHPRRRRAHGRSARRPRRRRDPQRKIRAAPARRRRDPAPLRIASPPSGSAPCSGPASRS